MLRSRPLILSASAPALISLALAGVSCKIHNKPSPWSRVDVADVSATPGNYVGKMVDARGKVRQVFSPSAFVIAKEGSPSEQVLILSKDPFPTTFPVKEGQVVVVLGKVKIFNPEEFKEPYGIKPSVRDPLDPDLKSPFDAWKDRPVIDADSIRKDSGQHIPPPASEP